MDTRLPRSPASKSPTTMFSSKSPIIYEKYKSGCAWGLIHLFDFRHGRSHGKLISEKNPANKRSKDHVGYSKDHRKASKNFEKSGPFLGRGCYGATQGCRQPSGRNTVTKNSTSMRERSGNDVCNSCDGIRSKRHDHHTKIDARVRMNEAVEAFVNQSLSNRSTDFIHALNILNSNKELFFKLLQDPNSLLVKHIQDLRDSWEKKPQPLSSPYEAKTSQSQQLNTIVVLKAGKQNRMSSTQSHYSLNKKEKGISPTFLPLDRIHASQNDFKRIENGGKDVRRKTLRTMDELKSLPVYDLPPTLTPGRDEEHDALASSPQMRFSPYNKFSTVDGLHGMQNTNTNQRTEAFNIFEETEYFESSKPDSPSTDVNSSSSPLRIRRTEDSDSTIDEAKQPSSPSAISQAAEPPVEPICIDIEEIHESPVEKQGSLSKSIRTILRILGLNWDELSRKWHSSDHMLDSSVFDNVKVWPDHKSSGTDHRLLFRYIDEVLSEIHRRHFRCSPWTSLLDPTPRLASLSKDVIHEVLRHVDWLLLLSELPQQTLHHLVENDFAKSVTWMDIRHDTEEVVTELADRVLEDLVMDAAIQMQT